MATQQETKEIDEKYPGEYCYEEIEKDFLSHQRLYLSTLLPNDMFLSIHHISEDEEGDTDEVTVFLQVGENEEDEEGLVSFESYPKPIDSVFKAFKIDKSSKIWSISID